LLNAGTSAVSEKKEKTRHEVLLEA